MTARPRHRGLGPLAVRLDGARRRGTRPLGDRVKQTLFAILEPDAAGEPASSTCSPGSGAAGHRGALPRRGRTRRSSSATAPRSRVIEANLARTALADRALDRPGRRRSPGCATRRATASRRGRSPSSTRRTRTRPRSARRSRPSALGSPPDGRVVAKHFWRDTPPARIGLLASERERRFGETALTFYRRLRAARGRNGGRDERRGLPGSFDPITNGHVDIVDARAGRLRARRRRRPREPAQDPAAAGRDADRRHRAAP